MIKKVIGRIIVSVFLLVASVLVFFWPKEVIAFLDNAFYELKEDKE